MSSSKYTRLLLAVLVVSASAPARAGSLWDAISEWQQPNIHVDILELHPYAKYTESYDSNIFLAPRSKIIGNNADNNKNNPVLGSWIQEPSFGLKVKLPASENFVMDAAYDFAWRNYTKDPRTNNAVNQTAGGGFKYNGPEGFKVKGRDTYINTSDSPSSELTMRAMRWQNTAEGEIAYAPEGGNIWISGDGSDARYKYVADNPALRASLDRWDAFMGGRVGWRVQPKTLLYAGYHRELMHFTVHQNTPEQPANPKDNKSHIYDAGIEGEIAPKLTGKFSTGAIYRRYDSLAAGQDVRKRIRRDWIYTAALTYKPLERTSVALTGSRGLQEATFSGDQYYLASNVGLGVEHKFPFKVTATAGGSIEWDKYQNSDFLGGFASNRRDDLYTASGGAVYEIQKWLKTGINYTYKARFSRFTEQFNYRDHVTAMFVGAYF